MDIAAVRAAAPRMALLGNVAPLGTLVRGTPDAGLPRRRGRASTRSRRAAGSSSPPAAASRRARRPRTSTPSCGRPGPEGRHGAGVSRPGRRARRGSPRGGAAGTRSVAAELREALLAPVEDAGALAGGGLGAATRSRRGIISFARKKRAARDCQTCSNGSRSRFPRLSAWPKLEQGSTSPDGLTCRRPSAAAQPRLPRPWAIVLKRQSGRGEYQTSSTPRASARARRRRTWSPISR